MHADARTMHESLAAGLVALDLSLTPLTQDRLIQYISLLAKWNRVDNLTAVKTPADMVARHLLDSLAVVPYIKGSRVIDVGTGAGLPGIPLALACPQVEFVLLDSQRKRIRFVMQAVAELGLGNVVAVHSPAQAYRPPQAFTTVVSRALMSLADFVNETSHLKSEAGQWLAMKGGVPTQELAQLAATVSVRQVIPLTVPGLAAQRCLVRLATE